LALPLLAMIAWKGPPAARCAMSSRTGAAFTSFVVNVPAATQGSSL